MYNRFEDQKTGRKGDPFYLFLLLLQYSHILSLIRLLLVCSPWLYECVRLIYVLIYSWVFLCLMLYNYLQQKIGFIGLIFLTFVLFKTLTEDFARKEVRSHSSHSVLGDSAEEQLKDSSTFVSCAHDI